MTTTTFAITGHRALDRFPRAQTTIRKTLRRLAHQHPAALWLAGGAIGVDQVAVDELLELGQRVRLVLPFPIPIQAALWSPDQKATLLDQSERVEAVQIVRQTYHPGAYHQRNRRLVQLADLLIAFWDTVPFGGTASTIYEAYRKKLQVLVVPL
jgi:uncharacterized phage-like protein YoqJ